jgi:shikimate kinase
VITLLIGHRGVGKTSLLRRIQAYYKKAGKPVQTIDLDQEIENRQGRSITDLFANEGEEYFREIERFQLLDLYRTFSSFEGDVFFALGAGFTFTEEVQAKLSGSTILWVRRETDSLGRTFLNRPRLNQKLSAFDEYLERFHGREEFYANLADEILTLQEGSDEPNEAEEKYFLKQLNSLNTAITVLPENRRSKNFFRERKNWGIMLELRDDLLTHEQLEKLAQEIDQPLISFRDEDRSWQTLLLAKERTDWAIELGQAPATLKKYIGSSHSKLEFKENFPIQKLALQINNWRDLLEGHKWWSEDPNKRSFLPMSEDGRWQWYRLWLGARAPINFIREGKGSALDQPTLLNWVATHAFDPEFRKNGFAAVLGDPALHSRTPVEQQKFFAQYKMPVFAIRVKKEEWSDALKVLRELGLKAAAVTAPLKELAFETCNETSDLAHMLKSVNTLFFKNGKWLGENTDVGGFKKLKVNPKVSNVIWGGGGTLEMTKLMVPNAYTYSAQTGQVREGAKAFPPSGSPDTVVWSVGRSHYLNSSAKWPPAHWRPKRVVDLNYTDDSPGLEYAASVGAEYLSGVDMFEEQARLQREFWLLHL